MWRRGGHYVCVVMVWAAVVLVGGARALAVGRAPRVVCLGETLFDSLPNGIFLGGAPLNVAVHLAALGVDASMASSVGDDTLGRDAARRLGAFGVKTAFLQRSACLDTGFVTCHVSPESGDATYEFATPSAFDGIEATAELLKAVGAADAFVHGSLCLREVVSAETIAACAAAAARRTRRVFDVNLRRPFVDRDRILDLMPDSWILKMNEDELLEIAQDWCGFKVDKTVDEVHALGMLCREVRARFRVDHLAVTRAEKGAVLDTDDGFYSVVVTGKAADIVIGDTVGAGDAFTARLVAGYLKGGSERHPDTLREAALLATWVATKEGATPDHDDTLRNFHHHHTAQVRHYRI